MNTVATAFVLGIVTLAAPVTGQTVMVTATGQLAFGASVLPTPLTMPVSGNTTFTSSYGTITVTTGTTTVLSLSAVGPPPGIWGWASASGNVLVQYSSSSPVAGVLRLHINPTCFPVPPYIDVEDDNVHEWVWTGPPGATVDVPVVLGTQPIPVRIVAHALTPTSCTWAASVMFLPQPANLQTVLPLCGPDISASLRKPNTSAGRLRLRIGNMNGLLGVFFVGSVPTGPGSVCGPASNVDASLLVTPSPLGVTLDLPLSPSLIGTNRLQYVELTLPFQLWWSNAVQLTLP